MTSTLMTSPLLEICFKKRMATGIVFQRLKISSSISIFDRHIFNNFVATIIRETNILVIFNVFMKYSALISSLNIMFNDEIYYNGGRQYFDFIRQISGDGSHRIPSLVPLRTSRVVVGTVNPDYRIPRLQLVEEYASNRCITGSRPHYILL